jgi:hypothetical protein
MYMSLVARGLGLLSSGACCLTGMSFLVGGAGAGDPVPSVTVSDDNIIIIDNFDGTATITITAPSIYAGEYIVDTSGLPGSPVEVVPVAIAGDDYLVGSTLTITPAIWLYEGDLVSITHDVYAGETLIGSDVGASFTIPDGALGATITVQENIVTSLSLGLNMSVSAPTPTITAPDGTLFVDDFSTYSDGQNLLATGDYIALSADPGSTVTHSLLYSASQGAGLMARGGNSRMVHFLATASLDPDQEVEAEYAGASGTSTKVWGVVARASGPDNAGNGYKFVWSGFSNTLSIARRVSGTDVVLGQVWNDGGGGYFLQSGDRLRLSAIGTTLTGELYRASTGMWETVLTRTDNQLSDGSSGLVYLASGAATGQFGYVSAFRASG